MQKEAGGARRQAKGLYAIDRLTEEGGKSEKEKKK